MKMQCIQLCLKWKSRYNNDNNKTKQKEEMIMGLKGKIICLHNSSVDDDFAFPPKPCPHGTEDSIRAASRRDIGHDILNIRKRNQREE
jgi:hypothetical protein